MDCKHENGLSTVLAFRNDLNILVLGEQRFKEITRQRLIIDNHGPKCHGIALS